MVHAGFYCYTVPNFLITDENNEQTAIKNMEKQLKKMKKDLKAKENRIQSSCFLINQELH